MNIRVVLMIAALGAVYGPVFSENAPMMPSPPAFSQNRSSHALVIGPADNLTTPKNVAGNLILLSNMPKDIQAAEVEIFVDNVSVGTADAKPYKVEIDCAKFSAGEHVIKSVAKDSSGVQVWAASTKVSIESTASPSVEPAAPLNSVHAESREAMPLSTVNRPVEPMEPNTTYKNDKCGFTIKYPQGWAVQDETAKMNNKKSSDYLWLVIGAPPVVVNIHCKQLAPGTTSEVFAKYNPYVQKWERRAVAGSPAFVTTDGKPELGRVVHRIIIVKDECAWMANCIDTTGGNSEQTGKLLEDMLETIQMTRPQVNIVPVK